jgi:beta-glucanase (GH16 family)
VIDWVPPGYSLAWADEFDGPAGAPASPATWRPETGGHGWGNKELQNYTDGTANAALDGAGCLAVTVRRAAARYDGRRYTSARLITKDLMSFRYGFVTARIRLPGGRGMWPAFWLLGQNIDEEGWPRCGEIDFHVYSVHWEPDRIRWFTDRTMYHSVTPADLHGHPWVFDHDFYLLMNVAVGGTASVPPDESVSFPQTMLVDYVCVYADVVDSLLTALELTAAGQGPLPRDWLPMRGDHMWGKVACLFGVHRWSGWRPVDAGDPSKQIRVCTRCSDVKFNNPPSPLRWPNNIQ